ncbi:MAG: polysaccharide biosynthesis C-terminal domain-containing protein [Oscillospiraceae bacterium]|nr:polysaccharide biosynthesis C-terminal domain-containing protein [Oscillospiraceae bacterium]
MRRKLPIFYSALLLTGVNLLLRLVSTSFQVHISARIGAAGVGLLQLVMSVGALAMTAGMAGVRTATMYLTAEELGKKRPQNVTWVLSGCFLYSILCSGVIALGLYSAAPFLAQNWIGDPRTVDAIRLYAVFMPLVCLCGCMTGYFTAANRIGTLAAVEIAEQLCYMAVTMTALQFWAGHDPGRACEAVVFGSGISACLTLSCLVILRLRERQPAGPRIPVRRRLLHTAVPLALSDDLKAGISTTENLMVPKRLALFPGELTPLATFGMVCGMVFPVLMFPAAILFALAELLIPELARCNAAGSQRRIRYLVKRGLRVAMLYGCACSGLMYLLSEALCMALYDNALAGSHLRRYSILIPMLYCDAITDAMTKGLGQQKACVRYNILTSSLDVLFLFLLLPKYGMDGYFFSFTVTHLINFLLSLRRLLRITGLHIPFYIPAFTCSATLIAVLGAGLMASPVGRIVAFLGLLGSLLVLLHIISGEDIRWIKGLLRKK